MRLSVSSRRGAGSPTRQPRWGAGGAPPPVNNADHWFRAEGPAFAVALFVSILAGGTLGYMVLEGAGWWDAFYMTVLAVTTVELRPHPTRAGQMFTVALLVGGV